MRRQHRLDSRPVRCAYASHPTSRPHCQLSAVVRYGPIALCADCDARRSTLGKSITPHPLPPQPPLDVLDWIASADAAVHQAHTELAAAVARARARQHSWAVIGAVQHTSRQAASNASDKIFQSSVDTGLLIGWPLRSVSPVSLARGASPVKDRNALPVRNRAARPTIAVTVGAPTSASPGRLAARWAGSVQR